MQAKNELMATTDEAYSIFIGNPHEAPKQCRPDQIRFLRKNPLPKSDFNEIFNSLTITGKHDFYKKGLFKS